MTEEFFRFCPTCGDKIFHTSKCNLTRMKKLNPSCRKCTGKSQRKNPQDILERTCSVCQCKIQYNSRKSYNQAVKRNSICVKCASEVRSPTSEETKRKISKANGGENNGMFGKTHTFGAREKISKIQTGKPHKISQFSINKMRNTMRKKHAENFLKYCSGPRVSPVACKFIDEYSKNNGYSFVHGMNGGEKYFSEVGAFVDGWDSNKNTIFEYDERHHYDIYGNLKKKDVLRMNDLLSHTKGTVIRYNELTNTITIYEYTE